MSMAAFSPDLQRLASGTFDGRVRLWDAKTGSGIGDAGSTTHDGAVLDVAFSRDGTRVVSSGFRGMVQLWDGRTGRPMGTPMDGHGGHPVLGVALSPDGRGLVSASADGRIRIWDVEGGIARGAAAVGREATVLSVAFGHGAMRVVSGRLDGTLRLWNADSGTVMGASAERHLGPVTSAAVSRDGTRFVSGGLASIIELREVDEGVVTAQRLNEGDPDSGMVESLIFDAHGTRFLAHEDDGRVTLWNLVGSEPRSVTLETADAMVTSVAFATDGTRVACGHGDGTVRLWEVESGTAMGPALQGPRRGAEIASLAFGPRGQRIVSGDSDGTIQLWDVEGNKALGQGMGGHDGLVQSVAFSADGTRVVSSGSGSLRLWDVGRSGLQKGLSRAIAPGAVLWYGEDVIAVRQDDRIVFFNNELEQQGQMFLLEEGFVAVVGNLGVYAAPMSLKDEVLSYRGIRNQGAAQFVSATRMREVLFGEWSLGGVVLGAIVVGWEWVMGRHADMGKWAYPGWLAIVWLLAAQAALTMWVVRPARLASWTMTRGREGGLQRWWELAPWSHVLVMAAPFVLLGHTRRAVRAWLRQNRHRLEEGCFTERDQVRERRRFCPVGHEDVVSRFGESLRRGGRGLLWIEGVGGSGKSALAMYVMRESMVGVRDAPIPVFIGEDWKGSIAAQVARQLRLCVGGKGPSAATVRTLGCEGLLCPLVDSLSERRGGGALNGGGAVDRRGALESVAEAIEDGEFRHFVVTSREGPPGGQAWQGVERIRPKELSKDDVDAFVRVYASAGEWRLVAERIEMLVGGGRLPSPLFLRFAIRQARCGPLKATDRLSLVLEYVEALRAGRVDVGKDSMARAAAVAAVESVQGELQPQEFAREWLEAALTVESNATQFCDGSGRHAVGAGELVEMLLKCGVITQGLATLQFGYDPVAEYLAAWRLGGGSVEVVGGVAR